MPDILTREQIEQRLTVLSEMDGGNGRWREKQALQTLEHLAALMDQYTDWADLACADSDAELARDEALKWLRGERI